MKYLTCLWFLSVVAQATTAGPDISIFDSRTVPGESYLLIDDCFVPIKTKKTNDFCYIQKRIQTECGVKLELEKNCGKK